MPVTATENGVELELQRIEQEFANQRARVRAEAARFAQAQEMWELRRQEIDDSLAELKKRLQNRNAERSPGNPLPLR